MKTLALSAASLAAYLSLASPALAQEDAQFHATTLNLSVEGESLATPDMATITLGVQETAPTAAAAMAANATQMSAVVAAIKRAGVVDRDIQTSDLNLNAQYNYPQNQPAKLTGYQASNTVTVRVRDLTKLGATVDATVGAGVNQINGVSFGLQNPDAAEDAARQDAVKDLTARAQLYATATGYKIARLVNLSETGTVAPSPPIPMMAMARLAAAPAPTTPTEGGELSVRVSVSATYELSK